MTVWGIAKVKAKKPDLEQYNNYPDSQMDIRLPYNSFATQICYDLKKGTRFLLGSPVQAWQVCDIDNVSFTSLDTNNEVSNGYTLLKLNKVQEHFKDDTTLMVAWQPWYD